MNRRPWSLLTLALTLDALTVFCGVAAFGLLVAGGYRDVIGGLAVSIRWTHAAFAAVALVVIRHSAIPAPSGAATLRSWFAFLRARPPLRDAVTAFLVTRPTVLAVGLFAVLTVGLPPTAQNLPGAHDPIRNLPARWDAQWYAGIAAFGYDWQHQFDRQQNLAFFPAYPLLIRACGFPAGAFRSGMPSDRRIVVLAWCGLLISLAAFFWAAWYFARLSHEVLGEDRGGIAVLLLAAYPFAVFFSAPYTEAVFLLAALGAWQHLRRDEGLRASVWGLLAGLVRPNGCLLSIPLALLALGIRDAGDCSRVPQTRRRVLRRLAIAATPALGMVLFTGYVYQLTGIWFAWSRMHAAWGRVFGSDAFSGLIDTIRSDGLLRIVVDHPYDSLNAVGLLFAVGLIRPVWRHVGPAWAIFVGANIVAPLFAGGLLSLGRLTSTLFPLFLALAAALRPRACAQVTAVFGMLQGLVAMLFFTWREMY